MDNPEDVTKGKISWTEGAMVASFVAQTAETRPHREQSTSNNKKAPSEPKKSQRRTLFGRFSPSEVGCVFFVIAIGIVLLTLLIRDLVIYRPSGAPRTGKAAVVGVSESRPLPSIVLIGSAFNGVVYYFDSPNGIFRHEANNKSVLVADFPDFEEFHWSPTRGQLAFVVQNRTDALPRLYILDLVSPPPEKTLHLVTPRDSDGFPANFGLRADSPIEWSQDENHVAFVAYDDLERAALFVTEVPTGTVRRLTEGSEPVTSVAWEAYMDTRGIVDERIVYVLVRDDIELTYSIEKDGAENNPWKR